MAKQIRAVLDEEPYSAKLKFQVVLEAVTGEKTPAQIARAYGVQSNSVGIWKHWLLERGPSLFERAGRFKAGRA